MERDEMRAKVIKRLTEKGWIISSVTREGSLGETHYGNVVLSEGGGRKLMALRELLSELGYLSGLNTVCEPYSAGEVNLLIEVVDVYGKPPKGGADSGTPETSRGF